MTQAGWPVSHETVGKELRSLGFSFQGTRKKLEGKSHPDRNEQFEHIHDQVQRYQARNQPAISVDTKKKELVGNFARPGTDWHPRGDAPLVNMYDFPHLGEGKAVPYGVYDILGNEGWVSVGMSADTAEFSIARDAGARRGLDYLAIGDTHAFRDVTPDGPVPTVYPGAPEPTNFGEKDAGYVAVVAVVAVYRRGMRPRVSRERVGMWTWREVVCTDLASLRDLLVAPDLERCVLRVVLDLEVSVAEEAEVERILAALQGTTAAHGRAGVLVVDRSELRLRAGAAEAFSGDLPEVLRDTVERLDRLSEEAGSEAERLRAVRAMGLLYRMLARHDGGVA
ncbi:MAG: hypothetical protein ACI9K2_004747 [Myxococcota bacterium]|jgi:hypothetical protein